jgi:hypothetical protein
MCTHPQLSGRSVTQEIEYHFERLLSRPNLHVTVTEIEPNKEVVCGTSPHLWFYVCLFPYSVYSRCSIGWVNGRLSRSGSDCSVREPVYPMPQDAHEGSKSRGRK